MAVYPWKTNYSLIDLTAEIGLREVKGDTVQHKARPLSFPSTIGFQNRPAWNTLSIMRNSSAAEFWNVSWSRLPSR